MDRPLEIRQTRGIYFMYYLVPLHLGVEMIDLSW